MEITKEQWIEKMVNCPARYSAPDLEDYHPDGICLISLRTDVLFGIHDSCEIDKCLLWHFLGESDE